MLDNDFLLKIFKFVIVGFSSFVIDMSLTYLAREKAKLNQYVANTCGFLVSATYNFTLNRMWTFQSHDAHVESQAIKFVVSMGFSLVMTNVIIYTLNEKLKINFYIAKLGAIAVLMVWNFTINNLVIFAH